MSAPAAQAAAVPRYPPLVPQIRTMGATGNFAVFMGVVALTMKLVEFGFGAAKKPLPLPNGVNVIGTTGSIAYLIGLALALARARKMLVPGSAGYALTIAIPFVLVFFFDQLVGLVFKKPTANVDDEEESD
jgi:hypothetical protein